MRTIRVKDGIIQDIYVGLPTETIDALAAVNADSEFIETTGEVQRGMAWPIVAPPSEPELVAQVISRESVESQLERIISQAERDYLKTWPEVSKRELWPLFETEVRELATLPELEPIPWPRFPVLRGAIDTNPEAVTDAAVRFFAEQLAQAKAAHSNKLRKLETTYQAVLADFDALTEPTEFNVTERWGVAYGA